MRHQFSWPSTSRCSSACFLSKVLSVACLLLVSRTYHLPVRRKLKPKVCKPKTKVFTSSIDRHYFFAVRSAFLKAKLDENTYVFRFRFTCYFVVFSAYQPTKREALWLTCLPKKKAPSLSIRAVLRQNCRPDWSNMVGCQAICQFLDSFDISLTLFFSC